MTDTIGQRVRKMRVYRGLTQNQLAGDDFSKSYIGQIERGRAIPSLKALNVIAARLEKPLEFFVAGLPANRQQVWSDLRIAEGLLAQEDDPQRAMPHLEKALLGALNLRDEHITGLTHLGIAKVHLRAGRLPEAEQHVQKSRQLFAGGGRDVELAESLNVLGVILMHGGRLPEALEALQEAVTIVERLDEEPNVRLKAEITANLANAYFRSGNHTAARHYFEGALQRVTALQNDRDAGILHMGAALTHISSGDYEKAVQLSERALAHFERIEERELAASIDLNLATLLLEQGDIGAARRKLDQALEVFSVLEKPHPAAVCKMHIAECLLAGGAGEPGDEAIELLQNALATFTRAPSLRLQQGYCHYLLGRIARRKGDLALARQQLQRAAAIYDEAHSETAHSRKLLLELGEIERAAGSWEAAAAAFERAASITK